MFKFLFLESQNFHLNFKIPFESIPFQKPNISKGILFLPFILGPKFLSSPTPLYFIFCSKCGPSRPLGPSVPTVTLSFLETERRQNRCHHLLCPQATLHRSCVPATSLTRNWATTLSPTPPPLHQPALPLRAPSQNRQKFWSRTTPPAGHLPGTAFPPSWTL
jgi:hypothetical protein